MQLLECVLVGAVVFFPFSCVVGMQVQWLELLQPCWNIALKSHLNDDKAIKQSFSANNYLKISGETKAASGGTGNIGGNVLPV